MGKPVTKAPTAPSPAPAALAAKPAVASASPKPKPVTKSAVTLAPKASSLSPAVPAPAPRLASKTTGAKTLPAGRIKIFFQDKGYGFIALNDGTEAFFHVSTLDAPYLQESNMLQQGRSTLRGSLPSWRLRFCHMTKMYEPIDAGHSFAPLLCQQICF